MAEAVGSLELMLRAQGPLESDEADTKRWRNGMVKGEEETKELHSHGIYSSTHLLALKVTAELRYWMWRDAVAAAAAQSASGSVEVETALEAAASLAKRTLQEYVHICDDIMPGRGAFLIKPTALYPIKSAASPLLTTSGVLWLVLFASGVCDANGQNDHAQAGPRGAKRPGLLRLRVAGLMQTPRRRRRQAGRQSSQEVVAAAAAAAAVAAAKMAAKRRRARRRARNECLASVLPSKSQCRQCTAD
jgi:hypothetical protein